MRFFRIFSSCVRMICVCRNWVWFCFVCITCRRGLLSVWFWSVGHEGPSQPLNLPMSCWLVCQPGNEEKQEMELICGVQLACDSGSGYWGVKSSSLCKCKRSLPRRGFGRTFFRWQGSIINLVCYGQLQCRLQCWASTSRLYPKRNIHSDNHGPSGGFDRRATVVLHDVKVSLYFCRCRSTSNYKPLIHIERVIYHLLYKPGSLWE